MTQPQEAHEPQETERPEPERPEPERPVVMRRADGAALIAGIAVLALWLGLTDGMLDYLRPSMRPWLVLSGVALAALAIALFVLLWRDSGAEEANNTNGHGDHSHPPGAARGHGGHRLGPVGWLVGLPLVIAVGLSPGALGSYAIGRQQPFAASSINFDLEQYLNAHTQGGQTPSLKLQEFLASARGDDSDQALLAETEVRLLGFVINTPDSADHFLLGRLVIGCCAGDALTITVKVEGYEGTTLADDTWVEVTGTFVPDAGPGDDAGRGPAPVIAASSVSTVSAPSEPYEYPR